MNASIVLRAMLPEHLLLLGIVLLVLLEITGRRGRAPLIVALASVGCAAAAAAGLSLAGFAASPFAGHFSVEPAGLMAKAMVLALTLPVLMMSRDDFAGGEFAILILASLYGACLMQSSDSVPTLFLGLEILSLPVYVLVLLAYQRPQSAEAALKYLVLGGAASATFLMGASLLYGATGSMATATFSAAIGSGDALARSAVVLVLLAFFLKAAIVPFHAWAPDAYEGASVPVTAYMATIVKAAVVLAAVRLVGPAIFTGPLLGLVAALPLLSVLWGNLAAMRQTSLRRTIGYSSIAHAGYLYLSLLGAPAGRLQAVAFYLLAYGLLNLLALAALPAAADDAARDRLDNLKGLFHRAPFAALMLALSMLSLAGVPPFPGFVAKFLVFRNVVAAGHPAVALLGLLGSYLGLYFYLRVIQFMFMSADAPVAVERPARGLVLGASVACLVATGWVVLFPGWVIATF